MGEGFEQLNLNEAILKTFEVPGNDIRTLSPLTLAYIGDAVYEMIIRSMVLGEKERTVNHLHKRTCSYVNAGTQCRLLQYMKETMTEEEQSVVRRGRNAKSYSVAKHASVSDYRLATGFEALCGYLYLQGRLPRLLELLGTAIRTMTEDEEKEAKQ